MTPQQPPVTPEATPEAHALLSLLYRLSESPAILSGQHNQPIHGSAWTQRVAELTGHTPALWGQEIGFSTPGTLDGIDRREPNLDEAIAWHKRGAVITYTWHAVSPFDEEPVEFEGGIIRELSTAEFDAILTPGSEPHARWQRQVDMAAGLLRRLADANVPVLWRPYHEMNGTWFWWNRPEPDRMVALWRQMFDRLVGHHGFRNLVWVWNPNAVYDPGKRPFEPYYPGHDVVDALAVDIYGAHYEHEHHTSLLELAEGRPVGLGEVGELPTPDVLDDQPRWSWFMGWPTKVYDMHGDDFGNTTVEMRRLYHDRRVVTMDSIRRWRPIP